MTEELDILFEGIVRGYQGHGMSGFGYVVVEVETVTRGVLEAALGMAFLGPLGPVTRDDDGLVSGHVILCGGDHRPCRHIAEVLKDKKVAVGLDDMGLLPVFYDIEAMIEEDHQQQVFNWRDPDATLGEEEEDESDL